MDASVPEVERSSETKEVKFKCSSNIINSCVSEKNPLNMES